MKKSGILFTALMLLVGFAGIAQPRQRNIDPEEMAKRQTAQLKEVLELTGKQNELVYQLNLETAKKTRSLRDEMQGSNSFEGMREKMVKLREEQNERMKKILTSEQWKKYEKFQEERRAGRQQRRPGSRR